MKNEQRAPLAGTPHTDSPWHTRPVTPGCPPKAEGPTPVACTISMAGALATAAVAGATGAVLALVAIHIANPPEPVPAPTVALVCPTPSATGYLVRVPVVANLDETRPALTFGRTVYHLPGALNRPVSPLSPLLEHRTAIVFGDADAGYLHVLETATGSSHRALELHFEPASTDAWTGRVRRTRIETITATDDPSPEHPLALVDWANLPPPDWIDRAATRGERLVRVLDGPTEWLDCDPLPPNEHDAAFAAILAADTPASK